MKYGFQSQNPFPFLQFSIFLFFDLKSKSMSFLVNENTFLLNPFLKAVFIFKIWLFLYIELA